MGLTTFTFCEFTLLWVPWSAKKWKKKNSRSSNPSCAFDAHEETDWNRPDNYAKRTSFKTKGVPREIFCNFKDRIWWQPFWWEGTIFRVLCVLNWTEQNVTVVLAKFQKNTKPMKKVQLHFLLRVQHPVQFFLKGFERACVFPNKWVVVGINSSNLEEDWRKENKVAYAASNW